MPVQAAMGAVKKNRRNAMRWFHKYCGFIAAVVTVFGLAIGAQSAVSRVGSLDRQARANTGRRIALTGSAENMQAAWVGSDFFRILGVQAQIGRIFSDGDGQPGRGRVAVISDGFWKSRFAASPGVLGRTLLINGVPFSIIGVAPAGMSFPDGSLGDVDIWMPLVTSFGAAV